MTAQATPSVPPEWMTYGQDTAGVREFISRYQPSPMSVRCFDLHEGGDMSEETVFTDVSLMLSHLSTSISSSTRVRVITVEALSGLCLSALGSVFDIHMDFWSWIISDDAADGYWLHDHNHGKVLCYDLPAIEFFRGVTLPTTRIVRDGRLQHLSSIHRFFSDGMTKESPPLKDLYINRRISGYLMRHNDISVFIHFAEDIAAVSAVPLIPHPSNDPVTGGWLRGLFQQLETKVLEEIIDDAFNIITRIEHNVLYGWHAFATKLMHDLERTENALTDKNLQTIATYLNVDVVQTLDRFTQQMEGHEGFLRHCTKGSRIKYTFRAKDYADGEFIRLEKNAQNIQRRLARLTKRATRLSTIIHNRITYQQADLAIRHAETSTEIARLQQFESQVTANQNQSVARITIIATLFIPSSFAASVLSINSPLWIFVIVAIPCTILTILVIMSLNCMARRLALKRLQNRIVQTV